MQVVATNAGLTLELREHPKPEPGRGEVLLQVLAAGVTPTELAWYPTTHNRNGTPRRVCIPGHEFSGVVRGLGANAHPFQVGDAVFGMNDWFQDGATAEFCLALASSLAVKPAALTHEQAATVPIAALTAWQGLFTRAHLRPGERVLIHGGAGSVGSFAVQLAALHGAYVIATAGAEALGEVRQLGAVEVVDYRNERFEDRTSDIDIVFDTVGGDTLARSWRVLAPGGRLVTIAADVESSSEPRAKQAFFIVEPDGRQLGDVGTLLEKGTLRTCVRAAVPLDQADLAYRRKVLAKQACGKVVLTPHE